MNLTRRQMIQGMVRLGSAVGVSQAFADRLYEKTPHTSMIERKSKPTLTPVGLNHGDKLWFWLANGARWEMTLQHTSASVVSRGFDAQYHDPGHEGGDITVYALDCDILVNGKPYHLRREVGSQASFYEPWEMDGVHIWFDAASCAFKEDGGFMAEKDRQRMGLICKPDHHARFAVHEAHLPICPEPMRPWYASKHKRIDIRDCYNGEDCWMGPYNGGAAHCGLDINMPAGTVLFAPISFDYGYLFHSLTAGFTNNRWRGIRRWPDGSEWWLQSHHLISLKAPENIPLAAGTPYADTAGVAVGRHQHTHLNFRILEQGGDYLLDPWILFWQIFRQP